MATAATPVHVPPSSLARWTPSMPTTLMSLLNPFAGPSGDTVERTEDCATAGAQPNGQRSIRPIFAAGTSNEPPSPSRSASAMFSEPETRSTSDAGSRDGSVDGSRRVRKSTRARTTYSICHPPPTSTTRQKLHRRPRSLLQLHRLRPQTRPLPAFEVIPSANFNVRLTRAITKVFKAKHGLCPNDLVILKAEKYTVEEEEDVHEVQDVVGLICKGRKDDEKTQGHKMKIHMASGRDWEAYPLANGGYEFFSTDEHGLGMTLRWVPKRAKDGSKVMLKDGSKRFNFSTISPHTRKHPVIATMSKTSLEVYDSFKIPDQNAATPISTPQQTSNFLANVMEEEGGPASDVCITDDATREIITVTSIWVAFREGWSPSFRYDDKEGLGVSSASPSKSTLLDLGTPPGSPFLTPADKRGSIKSIGSGIVRRASLLSKNSTSAVTNKRSSTYSIDDAEPHSPSRSGSTTRGGRQRADSSSTVLVHSAASNRRINAAQTLWRQDLLSPDQQVIEASPEEVDSGNGRAASSIRSPSPLTKVNKSAHRRAKSARAGKSLFQEKEDAQRSKSASRTAARGDSTTTGDDDDDDDEEEEEEEEEGDGLSSDSDNDGDTRNNTTAATSVHRNAASSTKSSKIPAVTGPLPSDKAKRKRKNWRRLFCGGSLRNS